MDYKLARTKPSGKPEIQTESKPESFTNSIGMEFVWIEPGTFMMGSPEDEKERLDDETLHEVILSKGFYMQTTPVTQKQWSALMGENPSRYDGEDLPVEMVCWDDAKEFIEKLNNTEKGKGYRLPTEAEWEYSCRAGTTTPFFFGETISTNQANYDGNSTYGNGKKGKYRNKTTPVKRFHPNAWGLYDMHGNVWEWCEDWYGDYSESVKENPKGPSDGTFQIVRGGSWLDDPNNLRSAMRDCHDWEDASELMGFRVVSR